MGGAGRPAPAASSTRDVVRRAAARQRRSCARRSSGCGRCSRRPSCCATCSARRPLLRLAGGERARPTTSRRRCSSSGASAPTTAAGRLADVPLLDEARALLGPSPRRSDDDEPRTYGHIVVDEAQDLSPMQLRMLARRSLGGSMTVVGDIAQATGPWAPASWDEVLAPPAVAQAAAAARAERSATARRRRS